VKRHEERKKNARESKRDGEEKERRESQKKEVGGKIDLFKPTRQRRATYRLTNL